MALAVNYKVENVWSNEIKKLSFEYDIALGDSGLVAIYDLFKFNEAVVIHQAHIKVKTAFASAGAATAEIGIKSVDSDAIMLASLSGALLANTSIPGAAASGFMYVAVNGIVALEIKVAAFTAGKLVVELEISQF